MSARRGGGSFVEGYGIEGFGEVLEDMVECGIDQIALEFSFPVGDADQALVIEGLDGEGLLVILRGRSADWCRRRAGQPTGGGAQNGWA